MLNIIYKFMTLVGTDLTDLWPEHTCCTGLCVGGHLVNWSHNTNGPTSWNFGQIKYKIYHM